MYVFLNGQFVTLKKAQVSVFDNGFLYGDGFYTTMRLYDGKLVDFPMHFERLKKASNILKIPLLYSCVHLENYVKKLVKLNKLKDARIRITVSRGANGFSFEGAKKPTILIHSQELVINKKIYKSGIAVQTCVLDRICHSIKTLSLIHMVLAHNFVHPKGAYEALLLDKNSFVKEGAATNVFMVKNGVIFTPKTKILCGITRSIVIKLAKSYGLVVKVQDFKLLKLKSADEIFLTNTVREIIPVTRLNGQKVGFGKIGKTTKLLIEAYKSYIERSIYRKSV